ARALRRGSRQGNRGGAGGIASDLDVAEADAAAPARAERLHRRFLGGEARGERLDRARARAGELDLARGEEALARPLRVLLVEEPADARDVDQVDADPDDHGALA